jgi:hypothetical protein
LIKWSVPDCCSLYVDPNSTVRLRYSVLNPDLTFNITVIGVAAQVQRNDEPPTSLALAPEQNVPYPVLLPNRPRWPTTAISCRVSPET